MGRGLRELNQAYGTQGLYLQGFQHMLDFNLPEKSKKISTSILNDNKNRFNTGYFYINWEIKWMSKNREFGELLAFEHLQDCQIKYSLLTVEEEKKFLIKPIFTTYRG